MERRALSAATFAASVIFAWLIAGAATAADPLEAMRVLRPSTPERAPDFAFTTLDGRDARVRDLRGKPILLGFFTTW